MTVNTLVFVLSGHMLQVLNNGYPYLRLYRSHALLMNDLLTNCSSIKSWFFILHDAVHSNRLILQKAAAELPFHSALSLVSVASQKLQPLHPQVLMPWHTNQSTHLSLLCRCFEVPVRAFQMARKMSVLLCVLSGVRKVGLNSGTLDLDFCNLYLVW